MKMIYRNVNLQKPRKLTGWRKISLGSWRPTGDSSIHTEIELDAEPLTDHLNEINRGLPEGELKVTFLNYFSKALGMAIAKNPQINSIVRFGKIYPRSDVDIFFHVVNNYKDGEDLSGFVIRNIDKKDIINISREFFTTSRNIKSGVHEENDKKIKSLFRWLPGFISRGILDLFGFILYSLNLWSPLMGSPRDLFGSVMLTYIGSFGADNAYAPIAPYTRIPMVVSLGAIKKRPYVIDDSIVARNTVKVGIVYDHRICDGIHVQKMINDLTKLILTPGLY
jgi:pyruvate dehydrogenase E2 component (dihydrolipoamide acetyltransferase)